MDGLLAFAVLVLPIVLAYFVRTTRWWWAPPLIPWATAGVLVSMQDHDHPGDVGGIGAFGNGILVLGALGLVAYGAILLLVTHLTRRTRPKQDRRLGNGH